MRSTDSAPGYFDGRIAPKLGPFDDSFLRAIALRVIDRTVTDYIPREAVIAAVMVARIGGVEEEEEARLLHDLGFSAWS